VRGSSLAPLVVVGDSLLDCDVTGTSTRLCPDAPVPVLDVEAQHDRPGGAGLAALLAAADGRDVTLVTAVVDDEAGARFAAALERLAAELPGSVRLVGLRATGATREKIRMRASGQSLLRVDRGGPVEVAPGAVNGAVSAALATAAAVLVCDYAGGMLEHTELRQLLEKAAADTPVVWDPHVRGSQPVRLVTLATPNRTEAVTLAARVGVSPGADGGLAAATACASGLVTAWEARGVAVTLGDRGALLSYGDGSPVVVPAASAVCVDPCGAGDRFAATAAGLLADGALPSEAVAGAVQAATAFVAAGGAASVGAGVRGDAVSAPVADLRDVPEDDGMAVLSRVRSAGGTVVATGGCFDLLHAGHVETLRAARALGDCLVVCLNSDDSVRRLKGPTRPVQTASDRAKLLLALECVDAVVVFDEDTPEEVLRRLRPDIWAKGGDYTEASLPEAAVLRSWGGQTVLLPFLDGRSTTRIVNSVAASVAAGSEK
jgi:D-beta-D-heptose 7-phosphate kinase/D-beta-D-heptose 1-phosphate adenosyltransferase